MRRNTRKRSKTTGGKVLAAVTAVTLGAGGLVIVNVYASAHETSGGNTVKRSSQGGTGQAAASEAFTIECPDVGGRLQQVPDQARGEVDKQLALLDSQISEAYQRLQSSTRAIQQDSNFANNAIMGPLKDKRVATIDRISIAIGRVGNRPQGLESMAACTLRASGNQSDVGNNQDGSQGQGQENGQGEGQGNGQGQSAGGGQAGNGPVAADFVDITAVQPNVTASRASQEASRGTFTTQCGVNENQLYNSDNVIVAPGVDNGAHHTHDYVGNQANDAFADNDDFAGGETTCQNRGDRSSYYWPVLRLQDGTEEFDAEQQGGGAEGNAGKILTASEVTLEYVGNASGKVVAMPKFLRIITGDAKAFTNGTANANAAWSCTGFEDRQLTDKYPVCPQGSSLVRTSKFQSCWDGQNVDSANHRAHVAFADPNTGACPSGFKAIPQLVQRLVYDVDAPSLNDNGQSSPFYAVDGFPEQMHKPITDHGDFVNVFDEQLMNEMVQCINTGRQCQ
ncbi:hypothetical protein ACM01_37580 [Streptomyces viridochromogenes]|uniref:DUF1996 domain-containing protein n=1 Tax=Streptomyces viridochromogenes TaxID=1938 RepID=A0A0J7YYY2_STRVR|nr:DUF1996 domain-containing protein [Streptomyces viridochromogenes]KMS68814.1 hypothetical protein ACM01_37580 [Streptomyces viridochromogenes]KOG10062.1 hypothetical protein ADK35_38850 [Streptomyces viridochromogenes]KOG18176.1 hypothetical protein ADK36_23430 [Streptomyces viridochromogenes]